MLLQPVVTPKENPNPAVHTHYNPDWTPSIQPWSHSCYTLQSSLDTHPLVSPMLLIAIQPGLTRAAHCNPAWSHPNVLPLQRVLTPKENPNPILIPIQPGHLYSLQSRLVSPMLPIAIQPTHPTYSHYNCNPHSSLRLHLPLVRTCTHTPSSYPPPIFFFGTSPHTPSKLPSLINII